MSRLDHCLRRRRLVVAGVVVLAASLLLVWQALFVDRSLPPAFAGGNNEGGVYYKLAHTQVGESIWLGLPPLRVSAKHPVRVTSVTIAPKRATPTQWTLYVMSLRDNGNRHITILEDKYFHQYGLAVTATASNYWFQPGDDDHYLVLKARFLAPVDAKITSVEVKYQDRSGRHGQQRISYVTDIGVQRQ